MSRYECRVGRIEADITTHRMLSRMGWVATKLYNTALWSARKTWDETGKIPSGFDLQKVVLASNYHSFLPAHTYQHTAHQVGSGFRSWYKLRKRDKTARPPGFRPKQELSSFLFTEDAFKATDNTMTLALGQSLKEELSYPHKRLTIRYKWNTPFPEDGMIKQVEIVPRKGFFEVHAKVLLPEPEWKTEGQVVAVDLGMRNPIVSVGEDEQVSVYKGGAVLAAKRYWNKEKARVQREVMERSNNKRKWSKPLDRMAKKSKRQVKQMVHAMTSTFVDCVKRDVKEVVIGDLCGIKKNKDGSGKKWNNKSSQNWQQFPTRMLVAQLDYKLARHGIRLIEQDERGTSRGRCSICGCTERAKIHRKHRGMFLCENCGTTQNADINGARNQLARYLHRETKVSTGSSGCLAQPMVYRWDNHYWSTGVVG